MGCGTCSGSSVTAGVDSYLASSTYLIGGIIEAKDHLALMPGGITMTVLKVSASPGESTLWYTPTVLNVEESWRIRAELLAGSGQTLNLTPGMYRVWFRIVDSPETLIVPHPDYFRVT